MRPRTEWAFIAAALVSACREDPSSAPLAPTSLRVDDAGSVIRRPTERATGCPATAARTTWTRGTDHGGTVSGHERWSREGSPHRLPNGVHLLAGSSVRIEPCAVVAVGPGAAIVVQDDARLVASGSPEAPVRFTSTAATPAPGDWVGLEFRARALPDTHLTHTFVEFAGAEVVERGEAPGAIRSSLRAGLHVDHVTVRDSGAWGVVLREESGFSADSRHLVVHGARGEGAVRFDDVDAVDTLPDGDLTGNTRNEVFLAARGRTVHHDATWRALAGGVRYRVRRAARILVEGTAAPRLTLAAGVAVAFEPDAELDVGWNLPGALQITGDRANGPVVLTAADHDRGGPARWVGVILGAQTDTTRSALVGAVFEGAGAPATGQFTACPIAPGETVEPLGMLFLQGLRADGMVRECEFRAGPPSGVAVFLSGDSVGLGSDFTTPSRGNHFANAGVRCSVRIAPGAGGCAPSPRCDAQIPDRPPTHRPVAAPSGPTGTSADDRQH